MAHKLIFQSKQDVLYDYCMYPYASERKIANKIKSVNILIHAIAYLDYGKAILNIISHIQESIGVDRTVYGIKQKDNKLFLEFYFYNYNKKNALITMTNLKKIFEPFFTIEAEPNEKIEYFMFSIEISKENILTGKSQGFHVYITSAEEYPAGFSYFLAKNTVTLENHYRFCDVQREKQDIINKIRISLLVDNKTNLKNILIPELLNCKTICVTKKKNCDCIYFSRITIQQLLFFLHKIRYPVGIITFIEKHIDKLDHLLYDAGFDYYSKNGNIIIEKSGFYGYF